MQPESAVYVPGCTFNWTRVVNREVLLILSSQAVLGRFSEVGRHRLLLSIIASAIRKHASEPLSYFSPTNCSLDHSLQTRTKQIIPIDRDAWEHYSDRTASEEIELPVFYSFDCSLSPPHTPYIVLRFHQINSLSFGLVRYADCGWFWSPAPSARPGNSDMRSRPRPYSYEPSVLV